MEQNGWGSGREHTAASGFVVKGKSRPQELKMATLSMMRTDFRSRWVGLEETCLQLLVTFIKTDTLARPTPASRRAAEGEDRGSNGKPGRPLDVREGDDRQLRH